MKQLVLSGALAGLGYWLWRYFSPEHSTLVLEDQVVVVTGASSGLGAALSMAFARRGANVVLVARREEKLQAVEQQIAPYANETLIIPTDITDETQRQQMVDRVQQQFGQVDVLVNCAGVTGGGPFVEFSTETLQRILSVNFNATVMLTREILPQMYQKNHGYVVNIGSVSGLIPTPGYATYSGTKAGLRAFSDALRRELQGRNIHVLYAAPGWMRSEMFPPEAEAMLNKMPQHHVFSTETVAEEIVEALVQGRRNVISVGTIERFGVWIEQHLPLLNNIYWFLVTRYLPWYDMLRKTG